MPRDLAISGLTPCKERSLYLSQISLLVTFLCRWLSTIISLQSLSSQISVTSYLVPAEANASPCTEIEYAPAGGSRVKRCDPRA